MSLGSSTGDGSEDRRYPIRVVAHRTGLKQESIRAWERRYGAVAPSRTAGRHRLYSDDDIRRLQLLRRVTQAGHGIGRIAHLEEPALLELLQAATIARESPDRLSAEGNPWVSACLDAVAELDEPRLQEEIQRGMVELGRRVLVDRVLLPLIDAIGRGYEAGSFRPMHEHLVSTVVRSVVDGFRAAVPPDRSAPRLLATTPAHQHHELGAALAAGVAASEGWRTTYLGPNLPAEEIAAAVRSDESTALALSIAFPPDDCRLPNELRLLRQSLPSVPILVGGVAASAYTFALDEIGAQRFEEFETFRTTLRDLRERRAAMGT